MKKLLIFNVFLFGLMSTNLVSKHNFNAKPANTIYNVTFYIDNPNNSDEYNYKWSLPTNNLGQFIKYYGTTDLNDTSKNVYYKEFSQLGIFIYNFKNLYVNPPTWIKNIDLNASTGFWQFQDSNHKFIGKGVSDITLSSPTNNVFYWQYIAL